MSSLPRRDFLTTSFGALAGLSLSTAIGAPTLSSPIVLQDAPEPKSLFLTWWRDPCTTMVVQWVGPEFRGAIVEYAALDNDDVWRRATVANKPFPDTDQRVHRTELTGLLPGTEYAFRIVGWKSVYRFRTMPAKATNALQFVSGGDSGIGTHAQLTNAVAAKQDPYFALIGGDLAYDNGKAPKTFLTYLEKYSKSMRDTRGRLIPLISCPGNHEVDSSKKDKRVGAASYLSVFDGIFRDTSYGVLDFGDYMSILLLDSNHISPVKGEQTDWLEKTLRTRRPSASLRGESRAGLSVVPHVQRKRRGQSEVLVSAVRESRRRFRAGASRPYVQADASAERRFDGQVRRSVSGRRVMGQNSRLEKARRSAVPRRLGRVVSYDRASLRRRSTFPRGDARNRAIGRHLHDRR
ncbi:MAG: metallophosphoesterase family protein [Pirellulales bacterium]